MENGVNNDPDQGNQDMIQPTLDRTIVSLGSTGLASSKLRKMAARGEWSLAPNAMVFTESYTRPHVSTHVEIGLVGVATGRKGDLTWEELNAVDSTIMGSVTPHRTLAGKTMDVFRHWGRAASNDAGAPASSDSLAD